MITATTIPGGWTDCEVIVGPHAFRLFTPSDPDELLNHLESPEATSQPHLADPYWAKLWPAAPQLAAAILRYRPPPGTRVLELGCGSGLAGITALACGLEVTFSDYVPLAVDLALENAARNSFTNGTGLVLDWRSIPANCARFPLIFAADVTYDRTNIHPLLDVVDQLLAPSGTAWFGDAGRGPAEEFFHRAKDRGWNVILLDENDQALHEPVLNRYQRFVLTRG